MESVGVGPNSHTFSVMIDGCARVGLLAKAFGVYGRETRCSYLQLPYQRLWCMHSCCPGRETRCSYLQLPYQRLWCMHSCCPGEKTSLAWLSSAFISGRCLSTLARGPILEITILRTYCRLKEVLKSTRSCTRRGSQLKSTTAVQGCRHLKVL